MTQTAIIVYHSQATSARTRFLRGPAGCLHYMNVATGSTAHPASVLRHLAEHLCLPLGAFELVEGFRATDAGGNAVYLARATDIDPPATKADHGFVSLLDARDLPPTELELLGLAYQTVLGG